MVCCRWRTYLRPDVKHPHLEPFTEWEAAVIVQAQRDMGNNWLGEQQDKAAAAAEQTAGGYVGSSTNIRKQQHLEQSTSSAGHHTSKCAWTAVDQNKTERSSRC